jgi:flagellar hook-basal body complex protein FliE
MSLNITSLTALKPLDAPETLDSQSSSAAATPFQNVLNSAIQEVEGARSSANQSVENFLSGTGEDLHSTVLASQRADLEFQMFLQVRNKVVSAYQEIMKMQM